MNVYMDFGACSDRTSSRTPNTYMLVEKSEDKRLRVRRLKLDRTSIRILEEYVKDGRLSYREVARRVGVSAGTVVSRMKKLEKEGVIKSYSAILDYEKLGYTLTAVTEITVSKGRLLEMENAVANLSSTCAVYDTTGLTDAMVVAKFKTRAELSAFTKTLLSMPFIERTNTHIVLTTVKEDFTLPL